MLYKTTSINNIIGKIIRDTKIVDSSYFDDMLEWIPESMKMMQTKFQLEQKTDKIEIHCHKAKLPCGLVAIEGVLYNNYRLSYGGNSTDLSIPILDSNKSQFLFETNTSQPDTEISWKGQELKGSNTQTPSEYYGIRLNYIQTSFEEGCIYLYYYQMLLDDEGYPLIPDNTFYKEALYWYNRMKLIGSGYEDKIFNYTDCEQRWELNAARAISDIKYPSIDRMEKLKNSFIRLIPPEHYYSNFHIGSENPEKIIK